MHHLLTDEKSAAVYAAIDDALQIFKDEGFSSAAVIGEFASGAPQVLVI